MDYNTAKGYTRKSESENTDFILYNNILTTPKQLSKFTNKLKTNLCNIWQMR